MEVQQLLRRPASCCLLSSSTASRLLVPARASLTPLTPARHAATRRRTKKLLNVAPHPSFLSPPKDSDTIIINPPSSAPSVHHTPFKFLPKEDPRRRANLAALFSRPDSAASTIAYNDPNHAALLAAAAAASAPPPPSPSPSIAQLNADNPHITLTDKGLQGAVDDPALPPRFMTKNDAELLPTRHHMTEADVAEMRRLRTEDPEANSVVALARRFRCSKLFVLMVCQATQAHRDAKKEEKMAIIRRWGPRKQAAVDERRRRLEMLFRGEL